MMTETLLILTIESQHNHLFVRLMFSPYFMQSSGLGYISFFVLIGSSIINNSNFILLPSLHRKKSDKSLKFLYRGAGKELMEYAPKKENLETE